MLNFFWCAPSTKHVEWAIIIHYFTGVFRMQSRQRRDSYFLFFYFYFLTFIHLWETERDRTRVGKGQREGDTHTQRSRLKAPSCQHRAPHKAQTQELWDHDLSQSRILNWLSHPGTPWDSYFQFRSFSRVNVPSSLSFLKTYLWFIDLHIKHMKKESEFKNSIMVDKPISKCVIPFTNKEVVLYICEACLELGVFLQHMN